MANVNALLPPPPPDCCRPSPHLPQHDGHGHGLAVHAPPIGLPANNSSIAQETLTRCCHEALHILMVPFPVQGQINPMMQLAKALVRRHGVTVTFVNNIYTHRRILRSSTSGAGEKAKEGNVKGLVETKAEKLPATGKEAEEVELPGTVEAKLPEEAKLLGRGEAEEEKLPGTGEGAKLQGTMEVKEMMGGKLRLVAVEDGLGEGWGSLGTGADSTTAVLSAIERMGESLAAMVPRLQPTPVCAVVGTCFHVAHAAASSLGLPTYILWTQPASLFSIYLHKHLFCSHGFFPYRYLGAATSSSSSPNSHENDYQEDAVLKDELISYIPGVPPMEPWNLPTSFRVENDSDQSLRYLIKQFDLLDEYSGVLINSFDELEKVTFETLQVELGSRVPIFSIGPTLSLSFLGGDKSDDDNVKTSLSQEASDCIQWLDKQAPQSVLYISFGSIFNPSLEDLRTIGAAILDMKQPFLWVIRSNSSSAHSPLEIFPHESFQEAMKYGLIIPWAPQLQVLSHRSVGAFLSHCGWNSLLESIVSGVPIVCCPVRLDQVTNAKLVVDVWRIGTSLTNTKDKEVKLEINDVNRAIHAMFHEEGKDIKTRITNLKTAAIEATKVAGTSDNNVRRFIERIRNFRHAKVVY